MANAHVKVSKPLINWSILIGGVLVLVYIFSLFSGADKSVTKDMMYETQPVADDVKSLEQEFTSLSRETDAEELAEFEKALQ